MSLIKKYLDRARPHFQPGGRFQALHSVFDGVDTFLYTPRDTSRSGVHIHDALDSKRVMIIVVVALLPCLLFGMYNCGYQNYLGSGHADFPFWELMVYGFLAILPKIVVTYLVGLGIEFVVAQWRHEEMGGIPRHRHPYSADMSDRNAAVDDGSGHGASR